MAGETLRIELEPNGLTAGIVDPGGLSVTDECTVRYGDLPESEDDRNPKPPLSAAMDLVNQRLTLSGCRTAVIYTPHRSVSFRSIELPFAQSSKIAQVLPFELESLLPLSETDYISDFYTPGLDGCPNFVVTASIPETVMAECFDTLDRFGVTPSVVTHKGYAAAVSFFKENRTADSAVFVYLTRQGSTLVLFEDARPCLVRTFGPAQSRPKVLARLVRQAMTGFRQRTGLEPECEIIVRADDDGLSAYPVYICLQDELGVRFRLKTAMEEMHPHTAAMTYEPALGSGRQSESSVPGMLNFCTGKYGSDSYFKVHAVQIGMTAVLSILLAAMLLVHYGVENHRLQVRVDQLDDQAMAIYRSAFPGQKKIQDPYFEMKANAARTLKNAGQTGSRNGDAGTVKILDLLGELSARIETAVDVDVSRFMFNDGRVVLSGATDNFNSVDRIKKQIEASRLFKKVDISSAAADKTSGRVKFKFVIGIQEPS